MDVSQIFMLSISQITKDCSCRDSNPSSTSFMYDAHPLSQWHVLLVGAFINRRARLLQLLGFFFFLGQTRSDKIFGQFVQLNEHVGNAAKLSQRGYLSYPFFWHCATFFRNYFLSPKGLHFNF